MQHCIIFNAPILVHISAHTMYIDLVLRNSKTLNCAKGIATLYWHSTGPNSVGLAVAKMKNWTRMPIMSPMAGVTRQ